MNQGIENLREDIYKKIDTLHEIYQGQLNNLKTQNAELTHAIGILTVRVDGLVKARAIKRETNLSHFKPTKEDVATGTAFCESGIIEKCSDSVIPMIKVYDRYVNYCIDENLNPASPRRFYDVFLSINATFLGKKQKKIHGKNYKCYMRYHHKSLDQNLVIFLKL